MRIIAHLDMDAFFAAVEERDRPRLKGKPIVVGVDPKDGRGRGVVSTANYKARAYGIYSAMPITKAWEFSEKARKEGKSPAVFIMPNGRHYNEVSEEILKIVSGIYQLHFTQPHEEARGGNLWRNRKKTSRGIALEPRVQTRGAGFTHDRRGSVREIEVASVDEFYLNLSLIGSYEKAEKLCRKIKDEIKVKKRLTCSIGIGRNKLIAKIASDFKKPNGLTVVKDEEAEKFLEPLSIRKIPGIGPKTEALLNRIGVKKVADIKKFSREKLEEILGKWGIALYEKARGRDDSLVAEYKKIKSIGEQETFPEDSLNQNFIASRIQALAAAVSGRFTRSDFRSFRRVVVTVRFSNFETKNRSRTLEKPASDLQTLEFEAAKLIYPFFDKRENPSKKKIRLVGVRVERLEK